MKNKSPTYFCLFQAHLYSLGMTLLFAAEYNVALESSRPFSTDLGHTINK